MGGSYVRCMMYCAAVAILFNYRGVAAPISPLEWVARSIRNIVPGNNSPDRAKLLLGIHFYGIKFGHYTGASPVIGHE